MVHIRPATFALFINDLPSVLWGILYMLYADDAHVYGNFTPAKMNEGIIHMQHNPQAVFDWATLNGLELNVKNAKTNCLAVPKI